MQRFDISRNFVQFVQQSTYCAVGLNDMNELTPAALP